MRWTTTIIAAGRLPLLATLVAVLGACGGSRAGGASSAGPLPVTSGLRPGACADPGRDGVVSRRPKLVRADRDLDGDHTAEVVVSDRTLCTKEGNCHWNLFRKEGRCHRYLGSISAARIQRLARRGEDGFHGVRAWWQLTGGGRMLMQEYGFRRGGYRIVEVLLCRQADDDRILCAEADEPTDL